MEKYQEIKIDHTLQNPDEFFKKTSEEFIFSLSKAIDVELTYDIGSLLIVDLFLRHQRKDWTPERKMDMLIKISSFFGECIKSCYGGHYKYTPDEKLWDISITKYYAISPMNWVQGVIECGEPSLTALFNEIPVDIIAFEQINGNKTK